MVLASMQQKLDDLCDQMDYLKDGARDCGGMLFTTYDDYSDDEGLRSDEAEINIRGHDYKLNSLEKVNQFEPAVSDVLLKMNSIFWVTSFKFYFSDRWLLDCNLSKKMFFSSLMQGSQKSVDCQVYPIVRASHLQGIYRSIRLLDCFNYIRTDY